MPDDEHKEFTAWVATVRDPARRATEGTRVLETTGARFEYVVAPLPDGSWAVSIACTYTCGTIGGISTPWERFLTRAACVDYAVATANRHFRAIGSDFSAGQAHARSKMVALLADGLFGFEEPPPRSAMTESSPD